MRKLINKKGFSLVELMIVVVIMGILIAVAIPLYNAVTDNAEANTCGSNQRIIRGAFANWVVMNDQENSANTLFNDGYTEFNGKNQNPEDVFNPEFYGLFDGEFPACSVNGCYYVITKVDSKNIDIKCYDESGNLMTEHESRE